MRIVELDLKISETSRAVGYLHDISDQMPNRRVRPCVVICPGGGYAMLSDREKDPPALHFFAAGYNVFILTYGLEKAAAHLQPLMEASALVMEIRKRADEWGIAKDKIAILGFSAGGHLAASLGILWDAQALKAKLDTQGGLNRPDAMILCYPVISAGDRAHAGSIDRVSGGDPALRALFSLENQVTRDTPPAFVWHTGDDPGVPVENALSLCVALRRQDIPFEAHIFQHGAHGLSTCNEEVGTPNARCAPWVELCLCWLGDRFDFVR